MTNVTTEAVRQASEQRFRAAMISSASLHVGMLLAMVVVPMLVPRPIIMPDVIPVRLLQVAAAAAAQPVPRQEPEPAEAPPPEPDVEPEPLPAVVSEPEPLPRSIADLQREREAEQQRQRDAEDEARRLREEEADKKRREEADRNRREEEERKRREEEARRQPQKAARRSAPETQTARRQAIDLTGTEESQTSFTVEDFPFAAYLMRIRDMVAERWSPPPRGAYALERRVEIFFRIDRNGRLAVSPRPMAASGDTLFDQAAMRAVAAAAPFPPLPREYEGQTLGVRFAFVQE